jgi:hypothetical protein
MMPGDLKELLRAFNDHNVKYMARPRLKNHATLRRVDSFKY